MDDSVDLAVQVTGYGYATREQHLIMANRASGSSEEYNFAKKP